MGLGKILGGVALGVGAVALAPFTGGGSIVGAATLAGSLAGAGAVAAGAGAVGGAIGVAVSKKKQSDISSAKDQGYREGKTENAVEINKMKDKIIDLSKRLKNLSELEDYILAFTAVGVACAKCDGYFSDIERRDLDEFLYGMSQYGFSESLKSSITDLKNTNITFNDAMVYVKKIDSKDWDIIDEIIDIVAEADNYVNNDERAFKEAWLQFKAA